MKYEYYCCECDETKTFQHSWGPEEHTCEHGCFDGEVTCYSVLRSDSCTRSFEIAREDDRIERYWPKLGDIEYVKLNPEWLAGLKGKKE